MYVLIHSNSKMKVILNEQQQLLVMLHEAKRKDNDFAKKMHQLSRSSSGMGMQRKVVFDYLFDLKKSSLINMFHAAPFLCNGSKWVEAYLVTQHQDPEKYRDIIEKADDSRDAIIQMCMAQYDNEKREADDDDAILSYVSRKLMSTAQDLNQMWAFNYQNQEKLRKYTCANCGHQFKPDDKEEECPNCGHRNNPATEEDDEDLLMESAEKVLAYAEKKGLLSGRKKVEWENAGCKYQVEFDIKRVIANKSKPFGEDQLCFVIGNMEARLIDYDDELPVILKGNNSNRTWIIKGIGSYFEQFKRYFNIDGLYMYCDDCKDWVYYRHPDSDVGWTYAFNVLKQFPELQ